MKIGRNDPCPCGSGKKFKKCCEGKRAEPPPTARAPVEAPARERTPVEAPARELTPDELRWKRLSTALEACTTPAEKIDLFRETIEAESDLDGETIFNLALDAFEAMNEVGRAGEIDALVARIRERHPAGYEMEAYFLEASRAEAAILLDAPYAADALARFAPHAARHGAYRDELVILLEYHGRMDLLAPFTDAAWPFVRDDDDLFDGAIEDVAYEARTFVLCRWHDAGKPIRADDPELVEALERYTVEDDDVAAFIRLTTPPTDPRWTPNDFSKAPKTVELWAPYAALFAAFEAGQAHLIWPFLRVWGLWGSCPRAG